MNRTLFVSFLLLLISVTVYGKSSMTIIVNAGNYNRMNTIVQVDISSLKLSEGQEISLIETTNKNKILKKCQVVTDPGNPTILLFNLDGLTGKGQERTFLAKKTTKKEMNIPMSVKDDGNSLTLTDKGKDILSYKYTITMPPEGVDTVFARSGYIHPACTPSGFVLTTIQPKDHRHHYGIWNPWTLLEYDGASYDLWNLGSKQGTVRAKDVLQTYQGEIMSGFNASLDHNIKKDGKEKTIINETWKVKAWNYGNNGFLWDFESYLKPSTELPVLLKEYRYAGFGFRANKHWVKDNCEMISSEGLTRKDIDGTRGHWIYTIGDIGNGKRGGLLMMDYPDNYNFPEPLRIWKGDGEGYVFMNFCPTKNMDWKLESGKTYKLSYRLFAFDGEMTPELAESLWIDFAYPPTIKTK